MNGGTRQGIDLTRVLHAPQRRVFAAWTSPEDFAAWYGGEAEVPLDRVAMDVRPAGRGAWSSCCRASRCPSTGCTAR